MGGDASATLGTALREAAGVGHPVARVELLPGCGVIALLIAGARWVTQGAALGRGARRLGRPDLIAARRGHARRRDRPGLASVVPQRLTAGAGGRSDAARYCAPDPPCTIFSFSF